MRLIIILIATFISLEGYSQYMFEYGGSAGIANYLGDIGGKEKERRDFISDMKLAKTRQSVSGFLRYKFTRRLYGKAELMYFRISGDDKLSTNPGRNARNLSFTNDMFDLTGQAQFAFYENTDMGSDYRFRLAFRAYVGFGVGAFYSNPKAKTVDGQSVALRPLETEGVTYKAIGLNLPATMGFHFTYRKKHRFGWELNWRTTFTDYLDDISQGWGDPSKMTPLGAQMSNRSGELDPDLFADSPGFLNNYGFDPIVNPTNKRGDATRNDSYLTMNFSYSYILRGKSSFYKSRYGSFFGKKKRGKMRKIRAKF